MHKRLSTLRRALCACAVLALTGVGAARAFAQDDVTLLRVFLRDGTSLVSYGEPARVADRVVFSMPDGPLPNPSLHLVSLPLDQVDWDRTDRYANAARADRYVKTQAEADYAELSGKLSKTLNDVTAMTDTAKKLAIVEEARQALASWPASHFNYRESDVRQMVGMIDEVIADLRASTGVSRFSLSFEAHTQPAPPLERLLPPPTLQESIENVLRAARFVGNSVERASLLTAALGNLDKSSDSLPAEWVATTRASVELALREEARVDRSYRVLSSNILALANSRAKMGDVRGVDRLLTYVNMRDRQLGGKRPESITALIGAVTERLDAARRLQLARDRWALRSPVFAEYGSAIQAPMALWAQIKPTLEGIKALSGSSPAALRSLERVTGQILKLTAAIVPPEEIVASHALLTSAVQMAANAASIRRDAILANNMDLAWNASSAAAGALMLGARARADILSMLKPPQLR